MTSILRFPYDTDPSPYAETCTITSLPFLMSGQREKWSPITFVSSHKTPPLPLPRSCERFTRRGAQVAGITQYSRSVRACWKIYGIGPIKMEIYIWDFSYIWEKLGCCPFESLSTVPVLYHIYSCKSKRFRSNICSFQFLKMVVKPHFTPIFGKSRLFTHGSSKYMYLWEKYTKYSKNEILHP